jgi:hypothetical protein
MGRRIAAGAVLAALAITGGSGAPALASHGPCKDAGGFTIEHIGPTDADACLLVNSNGVMAGVDVLNNCTITGGCSTVGANSAHTSTENRDCVGAQLNLQTVLAFCTL